MADDASFQELLAELKREIEDAEDGDFDRDRLRALLDAVERRLGGDGDGDGDGEDDDDSVGEELRESVVGFEASHPALANALRRVADSLGAMGL